MKANLPITLAVLLSCQHAFADTLITGMFGNPATPAVTTGYAFSMNRDVVVSAVGIYDAGDDGLVGTNWLGIWTDSGSPLASNVFDAATAPVLDNHFCWLPLGSPLVLSANTAYRTGTFGPESGLGGTVTSGVLSPDVAFIAQVFSSSGSFTFPNSSTDRTSGLAYIGPNLRYAIIPELQVSKNTATQITLSWPTNAADWILEFATNLSAIAWDTVTNVPAVVSNQFVIEIDTTTPQGFYGLRFQAQFNRSEPSSAPRAFETGPSRPSDGVAATLLPRP